MSTSQSWSGGSGRQVDEVGWSWKVMEMGQGTDKDKKGKKGGHTMTVVQAHREGRWATWGLQGLDLVIQRSGMGAVPGCTRAGLPIVARRGSEVRGKSDKGDKPRKWSTKRSTGVCEGVQRCAEVHRRVREVVHKP